MRKKYKKIIELYIFIVLGIIPFCIHISWDLFLATEFKFINYCQEIYFFNAFAFAYIYTSCINKRVLPNKLNYMLLWLAMVDFIVSTMIYFYKRTIEINEKSFIILCVLALFSLIMDVIVVVTSHEQDDEQHNSESIYEKYSENRYERYLLERIDEKLNSIKNPKDEKSEEESKGIISSEELLNGSDILAEMLKNHIEIKEYFRISKNQSKFSFYFSVISSVIGIIVVIIAASGMIVFKNLGISIIAAVSGAITEIISGIVLWIHNKSALQLNYYYDSLHENEKFLSALNIADKLSEEKKENMYMEIIRKQIDIRPEDKENNTSSTDKK